MCVRALEALFRCFKSCIPGEAGRAQQQPPPSAFHAPHILLTDTWKLVFSGSLCNFLLHHCSRPPRRCGGGRLCNATFSNFIFLLPGSSIPGAPSVHYWRTHGRCCCELGLLAVAIRLYVGGLLLSKMVPRLSPLARADSRRNLTSTTTTLTIGGAA